MNLFRLPKELIRELYDLCSKFWWGSNGSGSRIQQGSWLRLCRRKEEGDFHKANVQAMNSQQLATQLVKWQPPDLGLVKVNSDATIDSANCLVGFGLVVRDQLGYVLGSSWQRLEVSFSLPPQ
ncbi:hypothetical protein ACOSP7_013291 [Xanthoceras sorbifolium]